MIWGLGCKRPLAPPHTHRVSVRMHAGLRAGPLPNLVDLRETGLVAPVKDQGSTGSCVGHSSSGATETAFALADDPLGWTPSEQHIYTGARAIERARRTPINSALPALQDEGALTEDAIAFLGQFGVRSRDVVHTRDGRNSDVEANAVNDEPTLGSLQRSASTLFVGPYAIDPGADDTEQLVKSSLASGIPVRVDALVDSVFGDWKPSKPAVPRPNELDPDGGGHAMYLVGYTPNGFIVRNSWGTSWGDKGDCIVSPDWLRAAWGLYPWVVSTTGVAS